MATISATEEDFARYYDLESYLFEEVSPRFQETKTISKFDFFCIVIWKANRAKTKIAHRLLLGGNEKGKIKFKDLDTAVSALSFHRPLQWPAKRWNN